MPAPPPESEPAMVSTWAAAPAWRQHRIKPRPAAPRCRRASEGDAHHQQDDHADHLGEGEAAEEAVVLGAHELDQETFDRKQRHHHQEEAARPQRPLGQPEGQTRRSRSWPASCRSGWMHRQHRAVGSRRVDGQAELAAQRAGGGRRQALGKRHRPGQVGRPAFVVAHQQAADAARGRSPGRAPGPPRRGSARAAASAGAG